MSLRISFSKPSFYLIFLCLMYSIIFHLSCIYWLLPIFGYFGNFNEINCNNDYLFYTILISSIPSIYMPKIINKPSETYLWYIFILAYVPVIYVPLYKNLSGWEYFNLSLSIFAGFMIMILQGKIKKKPIQIFKIGERPFLKLVFSITIIFSIFVLSQTFNSLHFVNIFDSEQIMNQRTNEDVKLGYALYPFVFLNSIFFPFLLIYGFFRRRKLLFIVGAFGHLFLFMVFANKSMIFSFVMYLGVWILMKNRATFAKNLILFFTICLGVLVLSQTFVNIESVRNFLFIPTAILGLRLIGISTMNFGLYYDFFSIHKQPFTDFSHVNIISKFIHYPYDRPLGQAVANYMMGTDRFNPNAGFWITDGYAAMGSTGIIIISIIFAAFLYFLDCMTVKQNIRFSAVLLTAPALYFLNTSFFTTLLTGGLMTLVLILNSVKFSIK